MDPAHHEFVRVTFMNVLFYVPTGICCLMFSLAPRHRAGRWPPFVLSTLFSFAPSAEIEVNNLPVQALRSAATCCAMRSVSPLAALPIWVQTWIWEVGPPDLGLGKSLPAPLAFRRWPSNVQEPILSATLSRQTGGYYPGMQGPEGIASQ